MLKAITVTLQRKDWEFIRKYCDERFISLSAFMVNATKEKIKQETELIE